ncbi:unnamed protein product [Prorocentrum cordatum]|uniref:Uncharacterized protein n=1 Tax=Prorocentrum cordatum TaxID=2364126 RepID=A0ABN9R9K6_9DINO|nr:unnamed protein product [Polarella glacialis]
MADLHAAPCAAAWSGGARVAPSGASARGSLGRGAGPDKSGTEEDVRCSLGPRQTEDGAPCAAALLVGGAPKWTGAAWARPRWSCRVQLPIIQAGQKSVLDLSDRLVITSVRCLETCVCQLFGGDGCHRADPSL